MDKRMRYFFIPLALSIFAGIVYLNTAAPAMSWEDALNLLDASVTFGINAPPAPLYVFLAHIFTLLPFGSMVFRVQLFSILLASATLYFLYRVIYRIGLEIATNKIEEYKVVFSSIFGVLVLGFSYEFWSQAQNTEKYMLESFFETFILYLLLVILPQKKKILPVLFISIFLYGLSTGTDPVVISLFPAILLLLWHKKQELNIKNVLLLGVTGFIGLILAYSYLPIMSSQNPFLNWGRPTNIAGIWEVATGQGLNSSTNGLTGSASVYLTSIWHYFVMIWVNFTPIILPFILIGGWFLWLKSKHVFLVLVSIVITNLLLSVLYLSGNQDAWYIWTDVILALFAAIGFLRLSLKFKQNAFILIILVLSLSPFVYWWPTLNRHDWRTNDDFMYNLYGPIKEPAILFGGSDLFVDNSYYIHDVSGYKPNVIPVLDKNFYINNIYRQNLQFKTQMKIPDITKYQPLTSDNYSAFVNDFFALNLSNSHIYIDYPALHVEHNGVLVRPDGSSSLVLDTKRFKLIPSGLAYEVVPVMSAKRPNIQDFDFKLSNNFPQNKPVIIEKVNKDQLDNLVKQYIFSYITIGDYLSQDGNIDQAIIYYKKAYDMDQTNGAILIKLGTYYVTHNQPQEALNYFKQGAKSFPNDPNWLFSIAVTDGVMGNTNEAVSLLQQVISQTKSDDPINIKANTVLQKIQTGSNN